MPKNNSNLQTYWNKSFAKISQNREPSSYSVKAEKLFSRNAEILDLGGGSGVEALYFISKGHKVTLIDISDESLDKAKLQAIAVERANKLTPILYDFSDAHLPVADNFFDIVYARLSLHYFNSETTTNLFKEIYKKLKQSGKAYITLKSPVDTDEIKHLKKTAEEIEPGLFLDEGITKSRYTEKQLINFLEKAAIPRFDVREITEDFIGKKDKIKSGNNKLLLNQIIIYKD